MRGEGIPLPYRAVVIPCFALYDPAAAFQILGTPRMELFKRGVGCGGGEKSARRVGPRRDFPMDGEALGASPIRSPIRYCDLLPAFARSTANATLPFCTQNRLFPRNGRTFGEVDAAELRTFKVCATVSFIEVIKTCLD